MLIGIPEKRVITGLPGITLREPHVQTDSRGFVILKGPISHNLTVCEAEKKDYSLRQQTLIHRPIALISLSAMEWFSSPPENVYPA